VRVLQYAIRLKPVMKYFGQLCIVLAAVTAIPFAVSLWLGNYQVSLRYGVIIICVVLGGFGLNRLPAPKKIQTNEAMAVTALVFLCSPVIMTWPVMASGLGFADALFETISAVTTTGLSATASVQDKPAIFLFSRSWMQWIGGLGVVVLSLAMMIQPGLAAKRLDIDEDFENDLIGGTRANARRIIIVYTALTTACIIFLAVSHLSIVESILYAFSAVSTGGFSPQDASLQGLDSLYAQIIVIVFSMAGGISLVAYHRAYHSGWQVLWQDRQIQALIAVALLMTTLLTWCLWYQNGLNWTVALRHGALNALSAQSTAGFASTDIATVGDASKLTLILSMAVGGNIGSTSGGIKILRMLIVMRMLLLIVQKAGAPQNAVIDARLGGRKIEADEIQYALLLIVVFVTCIGLSWIPFVALGYPPLDALFEVVSAISTAGLSSGITNADLPTLLKGVLCADMLIGRLEPIAWLVLLYPKTWIGRRMEESI
jgi:trk system potassium uptake protein TrkH